jgi:tetratricopeptide (TPR) repeat protein
MFRARLFLQSLIVPAVTALLATVSGADPGFAPLDSGLVIFRASRFVEAQPLFERAVADSPAHVVARCWLAETRRRIGRQEDAARDARAALVLDPHSSFAHTVLADCYDPAMSGWQGTSADSAWAHIRQAAAEDPRNGEAWLSVWKHSVARGDSARERESLEALGSIGYFTPAVIAYNRWQLEFLPPKAVLLTRGDMDTYPSAMLQTSSGVRADVAIVNLSLLNWPDYATAIGRRAGLPLPARIDSSKASRDSVPGMEPSISDRVVSSWADSVKRGTLPRPLAVAASASRIGETPALLGRLALAGPFYDVARDTGAAPDDLPRLSATVAAIDPPAFAGPWASDLDKSPIRVAGAGGLGGNLINAALRYGRASLEAGDKPGALAALAKLDSLAVVLRPGEVMRGKIRRLRAAATRP